MGPIDVTDLIGHPGKSREVQLHGTVEGLSGELARVPEDRAIDVALLLESVVEGVLVSGTVRGAWRLRCAMCLTEFEQGFDVGVSELFSPEPADGDGYRLEPGSTIELDTLVRDAIGVEMPFSPLCRPDCLGLCETCGGNRNLGECPGHERTDPRFAVLSELRFPELP